MYTSNIKDNTKVRNNIYYNMESILDDLYAKSLNGSKFHNLMDVIASENNIKLAYRNIKKNSGSHTAGCDGITIRDIESIDEIKVVEKIKQKFQNFNPKLVKRINIPKPNGSLRPIGIPSIWDRIIQQAILQVIEPIAEAKFHPNSNGFRPLKSCETAMAQTMKLIQQQKLYYVVELDLSEFFDNVNHNKLISQLWNMGICDKTLLNIIKKMLSATVKMPDGSCIKSTKGTPQGGVLSPLLANIVLNDFDWWIDSQWAGFPTKKEYACYVHENGSVNRAHKFGAMRTTNLKEVFFVRYADDIRLFCKDLDSAQRIFYATQQWLQEELKLSINTSKSKVVNLKTDKSNFLGFTIGTVMKSGKRVCSTHISSENLVKIQDMLVDKIKEIQHHKNAQDLFILINQYNSIVIGIHNYYKIATSVYIDLEPIQEHIHYVFANRLKNQYSKNGQPPKGYINDHHGSCKQLRYIHGKCVIPIGDVKTSDAKHLPRKFNKYTKEGREAMSYTMPLNLNVVHALLNQHMISRSMEYMDNRITVYTLQKGKCKIMKTELMLENMHCHHKKPVKLGGTDEFKNLIYVRADIHDLIHAVNLNYIKELLLQIQPNQSQLTEINKLRTLCELEEINLSELDILCIK